MTTNLNTNNSSQTLFRFAAMRNPELSDPKNKERRFIFRSTEAKNNSTIDPNLNSSNNLQSLFENPSAIGLNIYTEDNLKSIYPDFNDYAVWVARNKSTATKEEFDNQIERFFSQGLVPIAKEEDLWDNLVYQVVTQKDFYAKEMIMQFLHLNHILKNYNQSDEAFEDMKKAKVVLPKELFKVSQADFNITGAPTTQRMVYDNKAMKFAEASVNLKENQNLADSLEKLEKTYKKQYNEAYKTAYSQYEREIKPLIQSVQKESSEANRKRNILENRINYLTQLSVADPEKFYANSELDMELHRIKDEIMQITVADTEIPVFDFQFETPEIDVTQLERSLNTEDQNTLCRVFGTASVEEALSDITSFEEINQNITQNNQVLQQTVLNNTVLNQQVSASVGGIVIPVNTNSATAGYIPFSIKTYARSSTEWSLVLALSNNMEIVSANYRTALKDVQISSTSLSSLGGGSYLLFDSPRILVTQTSGVEEFVVEGEFTSNKGITYRFSSKLIIDPNDLDRMTKEYNFRGPGGCEPIDPPKETPENPVKTEVFIPSGFGMKNIGVADYLKVEQSTYCYVEGDVAHIENIMAREYKERATRRLKRSESQTTKSSESEKERLTDTTSTERFEMQSEVAKIMQESKDFSVQAGAYANWGMGDNKFGITANASYATHNSKEESNRQAVTEAKDITARALDRIVTKVKEERIDKILEEYEENNKHGFDNTKGSNHVVGVYRWVDKVVKNQIYNYGKRMMFEFMIPEPAKLHSLGLKTIDASEQLIKPVDPRTSSTHKMENFTALNNEVVLKHWTSIFNVEIDDRPAYNRRISFSFADKNIGQDVDKVYGRWTGVYNNNEFKVDEGYCATYVKGAINVGVGAGTGMHPSSRVYICGIETGGNVNMSLSNIENIISISSLFWDIRGISGSLVADIALTQDAKNAWLQSTFNKIIEAYETELDKYNQALAEAKALGVQIKGSNPGFYRKIENTILRKNCISYMIDQNPAAALTFGKNKYYTTDNASETFSNTEIKLDAGLDQYAAFVKFMEQAFEWDIMSYYFYPYYWGNREKWADMYQFDDNDPTFRAFMQSGMARVIVTVRPGFEEAVRHFLATGQIWNGGEVPVIDDPLFLSIVDEMRSAVGKKQGEPWREKIPTSLTILQADSIGLKVEKALPCNCEPGVKFDDQLGEMCGSNFELNNNQIGQSGDKWMEISFNEMDNTVKNIGEADMEGLFPRKYFCLGNEINIDRDAAWNSTDSMEKVYKALSEELSQIEGLEAYPLQRGITFKLNISKIKNFSFTKPGGDDGHDNFKFSVDLDNSTLKIHSPEYFRYGNERILDKDGQIIPEAEYMDKVSLSKFLI